MLIKGDFIAEYEDNQLTRLAKKIALSSGIPADAIKESGLINKKITINDKYADKFEQAIAQAKKMINNNEEPEDQQEGVAS
jgi:hypothetical protein